MKKYILLFFTVIASLNIYSQITTKEQPISLSLRSGGHGLEEKLTTSRPMSLSVPDMKTVYEEDAVNDRKMDKPYRVGIRIPVSYNSKEDGQWITLDDGSRLWQLTVTAESAQSLDLTFSKFWLPDSTKFFVYNPHTMETIGAITSEYLQGDKDNPDKFSTAVVRGDTLTLEYYQPKGIKELPVIELSGVYYGYRTMSAIRQRGLFGSASECEVNVNCSEGYNWTYEKRSVTCILLKDSVKSCLATGSLVMNTGLDFKPYVLTANHAVKYLNFDAVTNPDMSLSIFLWNYESPDCAGTQFSYLATVGATLIANPAPPDSITAGDFALLLLKQDPRFLSGFTPYYLGWDRSASYGAGGVCIHHPKGDMKKISTYSCTPIRTDYNSSNENPSGSYLRVNWIETDNGHGITENGSSGSPLINNNHKLIGQLTAASIFLSCANPTWPSVYGRFYTSWSGNGSSSPRRRLKDWLDPLGTNQTTILGSFCNAVQIVGQSIPCGPEVYYINVLPSDYTVEWYFQSSPYLNPSIMSQNTPLPNQCTINFASGQEINETLKARIKYNGIAVKTVSKVLSNVHYIGGSYSQEAGSTTPAISMTPFSGAQPISVYPNALVTITSCALQNKNVTYSGSPLSYWYYNSSTGVVKLEFPLTTNSQSVRICAKDLNLTGCEKSVIDVNTIQSASSLSSGLIVSVAQNQINFQIEETDKTHFNVSYPIEVINYETGRSVYSGIFYNGLSISTIGWKPGIYIAVCNIGEKKVAQKITLK